MDLQHFEIYNNPISLTYFQQNKNPKSIIDWYNQFDFGLFLMVFALRVSFLMVHINYKEKLLDLSPYQTSISF